MIIMYIRCVYVLTNEFDVRNSTIYLMNGLLFPHLVWVQCICVCPISIPFECTLKSNWKCTQFECICLFKTYVAILLISLFKMNSMNLTGSNGFELFERRKQHTKDSIYSCANVFGTRIHVHLITIREVVLAIAITIQQSYWLH